MADHPILFSAPMVRALLAGTKTQTRRVLKPQPDDLIEGQIPRALCISIGDRLDPAMTVEGFPDYAVGISGRTYSRRSSGEWRPMKVSLNSGGYATITLISPEGRYRTAMVHTLVCSAFHGARPTHSHQVRHLNGNRADAAAANLWWGTQSENWQDRRAHGNGVEGEKHPAAKLSDQDRAHIAWAVEKGLCSQRHAARILGMSPAALQSVCNPASPPTVTELPDLSAFNASLIVEDVRVQRLQDISEEDARAEGVDRTSRKVRQIDLFGATAEVRSALYLRACAWEFEDLWNSIHGPGAWEANPWVAAYTFRTIKANIDEKEKA